MIENSTPNTPILSDALAEIVTEEPATMLPPVGALMDTVGAMVSIVPPVTGLESWLLVSSNSAKRFTSSTSAVIVWIPLGIL